MSFRFFKQILWHFRSLGLLLDTIHVDSLTSAAAEAESSMAVDHLLHLSASRNLPKSIVLSTTSHHLDAIWMEFRWISNGIWLWKSFFESPRAGKGTTSNLQQLPSGKTPSLPRHLTSQSAE